MSNKIIVVTDVNSSMTFAEAEEIGVRLINMPFIIDGVEYFEGKDFSYEEFFKFLDEKRDVSTSQPSPSTILDTWDELLEEYDYILHIPMSSALSGAVQTAKGLAQDYDGRVVVVDNKRISVTQRATVYKALDLIEQGLSAQEICDELERSWDDNSIYIAVDTLELLKKGGRVTPAAAGIATALNLKPVLQIQGDKLDSFANVRGMKKAKRTMLEIMKKERETTYAGDKYEIHTAYSGDLEAAKEWVTQVREYFGDESIGLSRLPISISCHVGAGAMGIAICEKAKKPVKSFF